MRTTLNIDDDVLAAARERARMEKRTAGEVLSDLARAALTSSGPHEDEASEFLGFRPLPSRGGIVTNELVRSIRDEIGE